MKGDLYTMCCVTESQCEGQPVHYVLCEGKPM